MCTQTLEIRNSKASDVDSILEIYDLAGAYQAKNGYNVWPGFEKQMILEEIGYGKHFSILNQDGELACVFSIAFEDPVIWRDYKLVPAIYLHRISTHPNSKGQGIMHNIKAWAIQYAIDNKLQYIRMDTWADNPNLIQYYEHCGFEKLNDSFVPRGSGLPDHYENITVTLLQLEVNQ